MRATVYCETCGGGEVASRNLPTLQMVEALLLEVHSDAFGHRAPHRLTFRIEGETPPTGKHDLLVRCALPECGAVVKEERKQTPLELVNGHLLSFHTMHEGHPFEWFLDGRREHPLTES